MGLRQLVIDAWSWLNYKPLMANAEQPGNQAFPELASSWLPPRDLRRLAAYKILTAYDNNQVGQITAASGDAAAAERRELGDAAKLVDTALGYLLGSEQQITVDGAEHADGQAPPIGSGDAAAMQKLLRLWAEKELLPLRMQQVERNAVLLGDGVYVLAWDPAKQRPRCRTYDPGFYFPQWDDDEDEDFPTRVHLAWELPEDPGAGLKARVRRVTYELGPIAGGEAGQGRQYPWEPGRYSPTTCFLTDAEWLLEDINRGQTLDQLPLNKATFRVRSDGTELNRLDLMIDFIPVVHITNSIPEGNEHWGRSALARVLQALDELAATDSDASAASATTGTPIIGLAGARLPVDRATGRPEQLTVQAGAVWQLGDSGRMDALDTSPQLAELRARVEHLLDRIASNSRITPAGLGTLDATEVPSGYALQLALGPLDALVASMRLARAFKYRLLLKFVQRLYQAGRAPGWPAGDSLPAGVRWAPHTPTDRAAVLEEVVQAYGAELISLETAIRMLVEVGYPIDDVAQEVARIREQAGQEAARAPGAAATRGGPDGGDGSEQAEDGDGGSAGERADRAKLPAGGRDRLVGAGG
ncbi:phage portal protein [Streptomyces sp. PTM05]|uniref:Phage portal protein n=1 Tax=Streptantibioticus parmotrematis TaxID=2873249 RepID=A0ABS7QPA7_9ACTN|nr:phage portal protein [Streptantibioticus parmotrematis]MBY8884763.1 phage portal protein [Streptantibioticus parmotrematis]